MKVKTRKVQTIKQWEDVEKEIKGFLTFNPEGSLDDFFEMHGSSFRKRYYCLKPEGYNFPNLKISPKQPDNKKEYFATKNKQCNKPPTRMMHVAAFRRLCSKEIDIKTLYKLMEKNDIKIDKVPDDWRSNYDFYIELMKEEVNEEVKRLKKQNKKQDTKEIDKSDMEKKQIAVPIDTKKTPKKEITNQSEKQVVQIKEIHQNKNSEQMISVKTSKINALMDIAKMIGQISD